MNSSNPSTSPASWNLRRAYIVGIVLVLAVVFFTPSCKPKVDFEREFDFKVNNDWIPGMEQVDAIPYLEEGGRYSYDPDFDPEDYDKTFLLPLMKRLRDEKQLKFIGLRNPAEPDMIFAVIAELPAEEGIRPSIEKILKEEDRKFDGRVLDEWGHRWFGLDYFKPDQIQGEFKEFMDATFPED